MAYEAAAQCPTEVILTLDEYYRLYPEYLDENDIAEWPRLDPSIPTGQLLVGNAAAIIDFEEYIA